MRKKEPAPARIRETKQDLVRYRGEAEASLQLLHERLAELELALENEGWMNMTRNETWNFNREFLTRVISFARLMYLKNPLVKRATEVQKIYVWALGVSIRAEDQDVDKVIQDFLTDERNKVEIGTRSACEELEVELSVTGNLFFLLFVDRVYGKVRIRQVDCDNISEIRCNPEDAKEPWLYLRSRLTASGEVKFSWHPDVHYDPKTKTASVDNHPVDWDVPIYHNKVGGLKNMKFGVPEMYSVLDWATAYKQFLENWATIMYAYSRLAMKMTGMKGSRAIAGAKSKLNTGIASGQYTETNPPNVPGGWALLGTNVDISAVKTAGATTPAEDGRPLRLMIGAGAGIPDTFFGDVDVGNYATSQTLDRPTELKMVSRQSKWKDILGDLLSFVLQWSVRAQRGTLRGAGFSSKKEVDAFDGQQRYTVVPPEGKSLRVHIVFPDIVEQNANERIRAVAGAFTFFGKKPLDIIHDRRMVARYILRALGEQDADRIVDQLYPPGEEVPPLKAEPDTPAEDPDEEEEDDVVDKRSS